MTRGRLVKSVAVVAVLTALLAYLRDPPWVEDLTSGLRPWTRDTSGARFRWTNGHASFYVRSGAEWLRLPVRPGVERPAGFVMVSVLVDGRRVASQRLGDVGRWEWMMVPLPGRTSRRYRRIEILVPQVVSGGNLGVQLGEPVLDGR